LLGKYLQLYRVSDSAFEKLKELHFEFHGTSALFSVPVAIAAIVRAKQGAPLFEVSFLQSLLTMQFIGAISNNIAMSNIMRSIARDTEKSKVKWWNRPAVRQVGLRIFYFFAQLGLYAAFMKRFNIPKDVYESNQEFFQACPEYGGLDPHLTAQIETSGSQVFTVLFDFTMSSAEGIVITIAIISALVGSIALVFKYPIFGGPVALGLCGGMMYYTFDMERKRLFMRALAGGNFQDNQWGFGQVVTLFIWVPLLIRFFEILSVSLAF
jgi:hypothetical protein